MNSTLQCLSNTRALHDYILHDKYLLDINTSTSTMKGTLIKAFGALICDMWSPSAEPGRATKTSSFRSEFQRFSPRFMGHLQQDAQEFLRCLLEGLHEDVTRIKILPKSNTTDLVTRADTTQQSSDVLSPFLCHDSSMFGDIFAGQLQSTLLCTVCGHESVSLEPFWDLSLPIPSKTEQVQLQDCFDLFTMKEVLIGNDMPTCFKCQTQQKCTKTLALRKLPHVMVLHLKRFAPNERMCGKIQTPVQLPGNEIDLSRYSTSQSPCQYRFYGIISHSGTSSSGHYMAYCKYPYEPKWYQYNDSRVCVVSQCDAVSSEAYVLFLERTDV